ncbi:MAG TPA: hypothetical protein VHE30_10240 [Polyangiaceae bacterium]|nr:hypothetical protein [Polyangiaceae bacterium]
MNASLPLVCAHRPPCPGCPRLGEPGVAPEALAALSALAGRHGLPEPPVTLGARTGFRLRARLAVRGRMTAPKIGIFELGSHRVVDVPRCLVHHPLVNEVAAVLRRAIVDARCPPYSDEAHRGVLRYVQIVVERRSETAQVVLVGASEVVDPLRDLAELLSRRLGPRLHSLFWNGNPAQTNTILGPAWQKLEGPDAVVETIGGASVFYPPAAFGQNNLDLADSIVQVVQAKVPPGSRIVELYAGTGALSLGLVGRSASLVANEVSEGSLEGLRAGIAALPGELAARVRVVPGSAAGAVGELASADVVIVDPPRKGLDPAVRVALEARPPSRLVYVACGVASFLEDARALLANGRTRLSDLRVFDLFPHTEHAEVVATFDAAPPR